MAIRRTILVLVLAAGCASRGQPPAQARREPPTDPLAGKTDGERWAWAVSRVPELSTLTPRPSTADFSKLNMHDGRVTLYAPELTLGIATKQPPPCLPLPMILEHGSLVTRISLDGRKASPDLADDYEIVRLGIEVNDHDARSAGGEEGYMRSDPDPLLSEVGPGVIRYDGTPASYVVQCGTHEETRACSDGTKQVCRSCTPYVTKVPDPGGLAGTTSQLPTCDPCPPEPAEPDLAALNRVVASLSFLEVFAGRGPSFYTSEAACKTALSAR